MRAREILLEFDTKITAEKIGKMVYDVLIRQRRVLGGWINHLPSAKEYAEQKIAKTQEEFEYRIAEYLIIYISTFDPTKGKYSMWLINLCMSKHANFRAEDLGRAHDALEQFDAIKKGGYFVRNRDQIAFADINRFKTLPELESFVDRVGTAAISNNQEDKQLEKKIIENNEVTILFNSSELKIAIPHTEQAATFYGRNTKWCTAAKTGNMFESYNADGPLYVILDKKNNRRWQLHFETKQYMDERDYPIENFADGVFPIEAFKHIPFEEFKLETTRNLLTVSNHDDEDGADLPETVYKRLLKGFGKTPLAGIIVDTLNKNYQDRYTKYINFLFKYACKIYKIDRYNLNGYVMNFRHDFLAFIYFIWKNKEKFGDMWLASSTLKSISARFYSDKVETPHYLFFKENGQETFAIVNDGNRSALTKFDVITFYKGYDNWFKLNEDYDGIKRYYDHAELFSGKNKFNPETMKKFLGYLLQYTDMPPE